MKMNDHRPFACHAETKLLLSLLNEVIIAITSTGLNSNHWVL
jgi:hypothetical protein